MDASKLVAEVVEGRRRWGKSYGCGSFTSDEILDALVQMSDAGELAGVTAAEELLLVKRQLTAALAREAKQKKKIEQLQEEIKPE